MPRIMQIGLVFTLLLGMILVALGCDAGTPDGAVPSETPAAPAPAAPVPAAPVPAAPVPAVPAPAAPAPAAPAPITQEETMTTPQEPSDATLPVDDKNSVTPPAEEKASVTPAVASNAPVLAGDLKRGCQGGEDLGGGLAVGALAVDFTLDDTTGQSHTLSEMLARQPVVMVFGSFT